VITEDTALCFAALNGLPGPYIKFFWLQLGSEGTSSHSASYMLAYLLLRYVARLEGLNRMLDGFPTRAAWALCTFAYSAGPGTEPILFEGRTDGRIVPPRGSPKFGWGPVFETDDNGLTYVVLMPPFSVCTEFWCGD
jgi:inosine triphosphate pyrophosphatase